ncbi:hypothetical protein H1Z61_15260 [Bacillus aquiflavi]|uniref:Uncharacterized protein n=2 Tax=Bacillus aquiflavi TaxID=2672567 RepID=A0A6B3W2W1_9BACI|nr:hypothetical protein [Bacillus aquiflavi]MBA4538453.1 hypothetical protein [Bacillus aquiflavi]NEY82817.1 hypothetical protein [Bacillus aquiflavi]
MIVKTISNNFKRDITINKLYPVVFGDIGKNNKIEEIRIVDDFGGLSVYDSVDFEIYKDNLINYDREGNHYVYSLINTSSFLEDYYNDDEETINMLKKSIVNIFQEELSEKELLTCITSEMYAEEEKLLLLDAISKKLTMTSIEILTQYFNKKIESAGSEIIEFLLTILKTYKNQAVYDLFLSYITDSTIDSPSINKIITNYFDEY